MAAQVYSQDQLTRYLEHISYPRSQHPRDELQFLKELQAHHLARVPFESISLHYCPIARCPSMQMISSIRSWRRAEAATALR
jgi:hypothetical protein